MHSEDNSSDGDIPACTACQRQWSAYVCVREIEIKRKSSMSVHISWQVVHKTSFPKQVLFSAVLT